MSFREYNREIRQARTAVKQTGNFFHDLGITAGKIVTTDDVYRGTEARYEHQANMAEMRAMRSESQMAAYSQGRVPQTYLPHGMGGRVQVGENRQVGQALLEAVRDLNMAAQTGNPQLIQNAYNRAHQIASHPDLRSPVDGMVDLPNGTYNSGMRTQNNGRFRMTVTDQDRYPTPEAAVAQLSQHMQGLGIGRAVQVQQQGYVQPGALGQVQPTVLYTQPQPAVSYANPMDYQMVAAPQAQVQQQQQHRPGLFGNLFNGQPTQNTAYDARYGAEGGVPNPNPVAQATTVVRAPQAQQVPVEDRQGVPVDAPLRMDRTLKQPQSQPRSDAGDLIRGGDSQEVQTGGTTNKDTLVDKDGARRVHVSATAGDKPQGQTQTQPPQGQTQTQTPQGQTQTQTQTQPPAQTQPQQTTAAPDKAKFAKPYDGKPQLQMDEAQVKAFQAAIIAKGGPDADALKARGGVDGMPGKATYAVLEKYTAPKKPEEINFADAKDPQVVAVMAKLTEGRSTQHRGTERAERGVDAVMPDRHGEHLANERAGRRNEASPTAVATALNQRGDDLTKPEMFTAGMQATTQSLAAETAPAVAAKPKQQELPTEFRDLTFDNLVSVPSVEMSPKVQQAVAQALTQAPREQAPAASFEPTVMAGLPNLKPAKGGGIEV